MKTIEINSLPVMEVIKDLAKKFETTYTSQFCEHILQIPKEFGTGTIKCYDLQDGLGIIEYNCTFYKDIEIHFIVNEVHPLKFMYVVNGKLEHRFEDEETIHTIQEYQSAIVASKNNHGHVLNFSANITVSIFSLEINRKSFDFKKAYDSPEVDDTIKKLFNDNEAVTTFYYKGNYSLRMADVLKDKDDFDGDRFIHKLFMEAIGFETLAMHLSQYLDDQKSEGDQRVLRKTEFECIKKAAVYITENLENYRGIQDLQRHTGLNSIKLQKGFKHLFDKTVNQYVQDVRLDKARYLLEHTEYSISEIVTAVGLNSNSYFSRIFKEEYGISPSHFKNGNGIRALAN